MRKIVTNEEYNRLQQFNQAKPLLKAENELGKALADLDEDHMADIITIIRSVQNKVLLKSTKIRKLDQIMYRDGLSDCADMIEKEMNRLYMLRRKPEETEKELDKETDNTTQG